MSDLVHKGNGRVGTVCGAAADGWHWTVSLSGVTCSKCKDILKDEIAAEREAEAKHKEWLRAHA